MAKQSGRERHDAELYRLQIELVQMQEWARATGARIAVVFEGRDAAGKGGVITRILQYLNPRYARTVALPPPTEREQSQWYFQRYVEHLPAAGELVLFDRSWYNRAGVEIVMGFCTQDQYQEFLHQCPAFARMLFEDGNIVIKYWFSVSDEEQERRFQRRVVDPLKRWKLSAVDLQSRERWVEYSRAKDTMFVHTDIPECRWYVVEGDSKRRARINCIAHLLSMIPYQSIDHSPIMLPPRQSDGGYLRPPLDRYAYVPDRAAALDDEH
jgi:polyphosphate kinase 2